MRRTANPRRKTAYFSRSSASTPRSVDVHPLKTPRQPAPDPRPPSSDQIADIITAAWVRARPGDAFLAVDGHRHAPGRVAVAALVGHRPKGAHHRHPTIVAHVLSLQDSTRARRRPSRIVQVEAQLRPNATSQYPRQDNGIGADIAKFKYEPAFCCCWIAWVFRVSCWHYESADCGCRPGPGAACVTPLRRRMSVSPAWAVARRFGGY